MNFDELLQTWNSPRNNLPTEQQRGLAEQFTCQMIRRRRFQTYWLIHTFVWLTLITGLAVVMIASGKTNAAQEWGLFPLLLAPWAFAIHLLRRHRKPVTPIARGEVSIADSFQAALGSNRTEQSRLKLVGVLFAGMIPVLAVSAWQLQAAGKVSARELTSMLIFFGGVLLVSGAGVAVRYFGRLRPQQRQLEELLRELDQGASN